jgi:hypothetical protein
MNPLSLATPIQMGAHERNAVRKRLAQIEIVLGHPRLTAKQAAAIIQERKSLESALAADDTDE